MKSGFSRSVVRWRLIDLHKERIKRFSGEKVWEPPRRNEECSPEDLREGLPDLVRSQSEEKLVSAIIFILSGEPANEK